jgi:hypothetical protein
MRLDDQEEELKGEEPSLLKQMIDMNSQLEKE